MEKAPGIRQQIAVDTVHLKLSWNLADLVCGGERSGRTREYEQRDHEEFVSIEKIGFLVT
jgi:hypothetical protein